jgi:hypothetical protein
MKKIILAVLLVSVYLTSSAQDKKLKYEFGFVMGASLYNNFTEPGVGVFAGTVHLRYPVMQITEGSGLDVVAYPSIGLQASAGTDQETEAAFSFYTPISVDYAAGNRGGEYDTKRFGFVSGLGIATAYSSVLGFGSVFYAGPEVNVGLRARFLGRDHFYRIALMSNLVNTKTYGNSSLVTVMFTRPFKKSNTQVRSSGRNRVNFKEWTR